jgi:hypothetical protein
MGAGFNPCINEISKIFGASAPRALKGHDFSRAEMGAKEVGL